MKLGRKPFLKDLMKASIVLERAEFELLQTAAKKAGISFSALIRAMIKQAMKG